jgi:hypothetical protein
MFSDVGVGIPDGTFTVSQEDGTIETYAPLEAAGLERYPDIRHYQFEGRVLEVGHLNRFAKVLCARTPTTSTVSFEGVVGTRDGWRPMQADNICAETEVDP